MEFTESFQWRNADYFEPHVWPQYFSLQVHFFYETDGEPRDLMGTGAFHSEERLQSLQSIIGNMI